jgi:prefoldin subunit 5
VQRKTEEVEEVRSECEYAQSQCQQMQGEIKKLRNEAALVPRLQKQLREKED